MCRNMVEFSDFLGFSAAAGMIPRRLSFIVADRVSGVIHRFAMPVRPTAAVIAAVMALPIGWTLHTRWSAQADIAHLQLQNARLELENSSYRASATELTGDIASLQLAITNLSARIGRGAGADRSVDRLPEPLRVAAVGLGGAARAAPGRAFGLLSDLLGTLDHRLRVVQHGVARREALADATPTMWPADGWLSAAYGYRSDPFTGEREFHPAVDISTRRGQPVYATALGRVRAASRRGNYGNLIEIDHGFGLNTRYGHLSEFAVRPGDTVQRGDVIGYAGDTGRTTGYNVHYEVWANGRTINPLRLLPESRPVSAN